MIKAKLKSFLQYHELDLYMLATAFVAVSFFDEKPRSIVLEWVDSFPVEEWSMFIVYTLFVVTFSGGILFSLIAPFVSKKNHSVQEKMMMFFFSIMVMLSSLYYWISISYSGYQSESLERYVFIFNMTISVLNFCRALVAPFLGSDLVGFVQNSLPNKALFFIATLIFSITFLSYFVLRMDWISSLNFCIFVAPFIIRYAHIFRAR